MPTDLIHRIGNAAPAETIYRAITTEEGIHTWWMTDVKMSEIGTGVYSRPSSVDLRTLQNHK